MLAPNRRPKVIVQRGLDSFSISYSMCSWTTGGGGRASAGVRAEAATPTTRVPTSSPEQTRPNASGRFPSLATPRATSKDNTGEVHTLVFVEAPAFHRDARSREVLAEVVFADRPPVLVGLELACPIAVHVVDGGVLNEVRVPALEPVLVRSRPRTHRGPSRRPKRRGRRLRQG
jgi:hypothetical protein